MIFRQITALNDWTFGQGISGYARDEKAIELNIRTRLQSWKGDCFFALGDFVDWLSRLDRGQQTNLKNELKAVILQSFGVVSVKSIAIVLNRQTRACQLTYDAQTIFGTSFINTLSLSTGSAIGS